MDILEFLTKSEIKELVLASKDIKEFRSRVDSINHMGTWYMDRSGERGRRAFWSIKNYPKSYHHRALSYPHKNKLSDYVKRIWYCVKDNPQQSLDGIYIHQNKTVTDGVRDYHKVFGDVLQNELEQGMQGKSFVTACCELRDDIEPNVIQRVGSIQLYDRTEGLLIQATSSTHIGSDWLGIVTEFDVPIESAVKGVNELLTKNG